MEIISEIPSPYQSGINPAMEYKKVLYWLIADKVPILTKIGLNWPIAFNLYFQQTAN